MSSWQLYGSPLNSAESELCMRLLKRCHSNTNLASDQMNVPSLDLPDWLDVGNVTIFSLYRMSNGCRKANQDWNREASPNYVTSGKNTAFVIRWQQVVLPAVMVASKDHGRLVRNIVTHWQ